MRKIINSVIFLILVNFASAQDPVNSWSGNYKNENGVILKVVGPAENGAISFSFNYRTEDCSLSEEGIAYILRPGFAKCEEISVNISMVNGKIIVDEYKPYPTGLYCPPLKGNYIKSVKLTGEEVLKKYTYYFNEADPQKYFNIFLENEIPNYILFAMHQPTLNDCFKIFKPEIATVFYVAICEVYREQLTSFSEEDFTVDFYENMFSESNSFEIEQYSSNDLINDLINDLKDLLLPDLQLYDVRFENGRKYSFFCYVNNRWVLIPEN